MREVLAIRGMPRALFVGMSVLTTIDVLTAYLPAFAEESGISVQTVGWLLATRAAASVLSRIGMIRLMNWLGRRNLLLGAVLLSGAALLAFPFVPLVLQYVMMVIVGLGLGLGQPVTLSWVAGRAPRALRGPALGVRLSGNRLGQVLVPAAVGVLVGVGGVGVVFVALAASLVASGIVLYGAQFTLPENPEE
jgi:MFS family permease